MNQEKAIELALKGENIFLTGKAGCLTEDTIISLNRANKGFKCSIKHLFFKFNNISKLERDDGSIITYKLNGRCWNSEISTKVRSFKKDIDLIQLNNIENVWYSGLKNIYKLELENGNSIEGTYEHPILTKDHEWVKIGELNTEHEVMIDTIYRYKNKQNKTKKNKLIYKQMKVGKFYPHKIKIILKNNFYSYIHILTYEAFMNNLSLEDYILCTYDEKKSKKLKYVDRKKYHIHHKDKDVNNNNLSNLEKLKSKDHLASHGKKNYKNFGHGKPVYVKVKKVIDLKIKKDTYDISCKLPYDNFVANGIIVHNTGKTYTLNKIIEALEEKGKIIAKTASTGIASTHINGQTVHAWSGTGIKEKLTKDDLFKIARNPWSRKRIINTDVLIIDEISMLKGVKLDVIEEACRFVFENNEPFGGLQVIVSGDFFQLPPVDRSPNKDYCFKSRSWNTANFNICYLEKIYRQSEENFINLLNGIRENSINDNKIELLDSLNKEDYSDESIKLFCKNANVDVINAQKLNEIDKNPVFFYMKEEGKEYQLKILKKNCLAEETLMLKEGAKVMFIQNDFDNGIVNGTQGEVVKFDEYTTYTKDGEEDKVFPNVPYVKLLKDKRVVPVVPGKWEVEEYDEKSQKNVVVARINQMPLKLSWALTIHKSQGATFDNINIDLSDVFEYGMGYVALSRATSLGGISLSGYNQQSLMVSPEVLEQDSIFKEESKRIENC